MIYRFMSLYFSVGAVVGVGSLGTSLPLRALTEEIPAPCSVHRRLPSDEPSTTSSDSDESVRSDHSCSIRSASSSCQSWLWGDEKSISEDEASSDPLNRGPGIEVTGAATGVINGHHVDLNGWYQRRGAATRPPILPGSIITPLNFTDRPWYRNDNGCFIYWNPQPVQPVHPYDALAYGWRFCNALGYPIYIALSEDNDAPPPGNNDEWLLATRQLGERGLHIPRATANAMRGAPPRLTET